MMLLRTAHSRFARLHLPFVLFILIAPLFLQRCSQESETSGLRMVNGSRPEGDNPARWSAVALVERSSGEAFCSGTLVAPDLVVTAAHCIFDKQPEEFELVFGPLVKDASAIHVRAVAKDTFKKFQKFESNFDIGWVKLEGVAPAGYKPVEIWHQASYLQAETPLTIAGYGRTSSQCRDGDPTCETGQLFSVDTVVREFVHHARLFNLIVIGPRAEHGPCFGDSGGGAYIQNNGHWYVVGDFMGWDRILVPEEIDTICDTGHAIYNFVGDFAEWIESTSGVKLAYDAAVNPRAAPEVLQQLSNAPTDFAGWCAYNNHEDPAWFTVQRLIRLASDFRIKSDDPSKAREVFEDCKVAEEWLRRMLAADPTLEIPGFDPANFIDSARLEDVRPLASLGDMGIEKLVLSDHSIEDLSPLMQLRGLKHLEIVDNTLPHERKLKAAVATLRIEAFPALEQLMVHNSFAPIDLSDLSQLTHLQQLELSYITLDRLAGLERLPLTQLRLENLTTAVPLDLKPLTALHELLLNKVSLSSLPTAMPDLEDLQLLEVTGLQTLPIDMPKLHKFFIYASDYQGPLNFERWPQLEEISVVANTQLGKLGDVAHLQSLSLLEIVENNLTEIGTISDLPLLDSLSLMQNGLKSMPKLSDLPQLKKIDLDGNALTAVGDLSGCPNLQFINLNRNPLVDLHNLRSLPQLKRVSLQNQAGKGLTHIDGMENLPALEELNLARNSLREVQPFTQFKGLKVLVLSDNLITDVSSLSALPHLEYLEVVNNPLKKRECPLSKPDLCRFEWMLLGGEDSNFAVSL